MSKKECKTYVIKLKEDGTQVYVCRGCGREWNSSISARMHAINCKDYVGEEAFERHRQNNIKNHHDFSGERNPMYGRTHTEFVRKILSDNMHNRTGDKNPFYGRHHTEESKRKSGSKISVALKKQFKSGVRTNKGYSKWFCSDWNGNHFRSSCEAIYALWLLFNKIDFQYEKIRVEYNGKVYVSDFYHSNVIHEIKPRYHDSYEVIRNAFEDNNYKFEFVYQSDTDKLYYELQKSILNLDEWWEELVNHARNKNYNKIGEYLKWDFDPVNNKILILN